MKPQYAVLHIERGAGNDSGMSCHIERCDAKGERYIPENADGNRTHLNRELVTFPESVTCRNEAIRHRLETAGLHRKVGKNQTRAVRVLLTGSPEQMKKITDSGQLNRWCDTNIKYLRDTFGADNVVSCVLHMDETTPHLHATVVPIVTGARQRRSREGKAKYQTKEGPRLSAADLLTRSNFRLYQDTYAEAMKPFGLQRGIVGSPAVHKTQLQHRREMAQSMQDDIDRLFKKMTRIRHERDVKQAERDALEVKVAELEEKSEDGGSRIKSWFGKGELPKLRKELARKDEQISKKDAELATLKQQIKTLQTEKANLVAECLRASNSYKAEIDEAIARAELAEKRLEERTAEADRYHEMLYPERYRLTSGAKLKAYRLPNKVWSNLSIITLFGGQEYKTDAYDIPKELLKKLDTREITPEELVNEVFSPWEQISESQHQILETMLMTAAGGMATAHVGTGAGGSTSDLPWRDRDNDRNRYRRKQL